MRWRVVHLASLLLGSGTFALAQRLLDRRQTEMFTNEKAEEQVKMESLIESEISCTTWMQERLNATPMFA